MTLIATYTTTQAGTHVIKAQTRSTTGNLGGTGLPAINAIAFRP